MMTHSRGVSYYGGKLAGITQHCAAAGSEGGFYIWRDDKKNVSSDGFRNFLKSLNFCLNCHRSLRVLKYIWKEKQFSVVFSLPFHGSYLRIIVCKKLQQGC